MKEGNKRIELNSQESLDYTDVDINIEGNVTRSILYTLLPFFSMIAAILPGVLAKTSGTEIAKNGILTLVLTGVASFYIRINSSEILYKKLSKAVIALGYLGSIFLLFLIPQPDILSFWMIGGLLVAMLVDMKLGLLLHFNLTFILGMSLSLYPEIVIKLLITGALMCLLSGALNDKSTFLYAMIIIISTNITLSFAINNFIFESSINYNYLSSLFCTLAVLVTAYLVRYFYSRLQSSTSIHNSMDTKIPFPMTPDDDLSLDMDQQKKLTACNIDAFPDDTDSSLQIQAVAEAENANQKLGIRTSYEILCNPENDLLKRMKQSSEELYQHSLYISDLSYRAALKIGADDLITKAGGLYHEIGKMNSSNYIEEGLIIAEEYSFPKELTLILKEHNIKYEKPTTIESVIVMLSDHLVSTIDYIEKSGDHKFTRNKIIDNLFQMRMEKGTFDAANISLKDFKRLKDFYQKELSG